MATRALSRLRNTYLASKLLGDIMRTPKKGHACPARSNIAVSECKSSKLISGFRQYHDGRPRGPLWRGKKLIGKEALVVILGLKRFKDDEEKLLKFINTQVLRLLKMDMIPVLTELERQEEVIQKQDWYRLDVFLYKDLIIALAQVKKMDEVMQLWESMRKEDLFPDSQTYTEVIRRFLSYGSPADTMNIYEDMKNSPDSPEELPSHILIIEFSFWKTLIWNSSPFIIKSNSFAKLISMFDTVRMSSSRKFVEAKYQ